MSKDQDTPLSAETLNAVSTKLPQFWHGRPKVWFITAEAEFDNKNITADDTKYRYVVMALGLEVASRVSDFLEDPPTKDKYAALKKRLIEEYSLQPMAKAKRLANPPELGDKKPSQLMSSMLDLAEGGVEKTPLFKWLFIQRMPQEIHPLLESHNEENMREFAKFADRLHEMARPTISAVQVPSENFDSVELNATSFGQNTTGNRRRLCYAHYRYGENARQCKAPCGWISNRRAGNASAGRR